MNSTTQIGLATLDAISDRIHTELVKRGFHTPITVTPELNRHKTALTLKITSEPFQTTPVLFKSVEIISFGSGVAKREGDREGMLRIYISVHVAWTSFSGGTNATELFTFTCCTSEEGDDIFNVQIG